VFVFVRDWGRKRKVDEEEEEDSEEDEEGQNRDVSQKKPQETKEKRDLRKRRLRAQQVRRDLLATIKEREHDLLLADNELEFQRARMNNDIGGVNKDGVKFKMRARKR